MNSFIKGVFLTLLCAILMSGFYNIFFTVPISYKDVTVNGALQFVSMQMEYPISRYYYNYCYIPYMHMTDSIDKSLGGTLSVDVSSWGDTESNLSSNTSENVSFGSSYNHYSTGWK